jgi:MinD-like ATPase involved in chromosome partitioning or flagellar assembly
LPAEPSAAPPSTLAFIVLLNDAAEACALSRLLEAVRAPGATVGASFLTPPVRGLGFFADDARQGEVDAWWSANVPRDALPIYLLMDEPGLEDWTQAVDGDVYVGLGDPRRAADFAAAENAHPAAGPARSRVRAFPCSGPLDLAAVVAHDLSAAVPGGEPVFDPVEAVRLSALSPGSPLRRELAAAGPSRPAPDAAALSAPGPGAPLTSPRRGTGTAPQPDGRMVPSSPRALAPKPASGRVRASVEGIAGLFRRRGFTPRSDSDLARLLAARAPTVVVTGSRKGGVGKTSFAAGIAIVAGSVLDLIGHRACIVDANIANPDAWGELQLPPGAATVRDTVAALLAGREPPPPIHATTPALACYPEVRDPTEYSRAAIHRLADHLRLRYTVTVVDMSNRLPDPTAGPEAAVAAYWLEVADALVLPTTAARADFNGALDYLEVGGLPPTLVPYIVADDRRLRDNPATQEYLRAVRRRAHRIVEVPDEADAVRLAGLEGVPVEQLSPRLRLAYRELTEAIATLPRRPGR